MTESALYEILTPWEVDPYKLLSWWDMERFSASTFQQIVTGLIFLISRIEHLSEMAGGEDVEAGDLAVKFVPMVVEFRSECEKLKLRTSMAYADEFISLADGMTSKGLVLGLRQLESVIRNEMKSHLFFWVDNPSFYKQRQPFGARVAVWFPELEYDITEAGNCIAFDRGTASVFHLMRVMEVGVQRFGTRLGVPLANELNWQTILDLVNPAIKVMKAKHQETIAISQVASHLYNVKVTWRNPTMHPTSKYTPEEAKDVYHNVKTFMGSLADLELVLGKGLSGSA
ncbi:MAG TPA: hypothetical protein VG267_22690 [Terracidiphilus sp.]|jgi:hypothetical protein|nr:hypothetical protein [Terracidiphilus sp.]